MAEFRPLAGCPLCGDQLEVVTAEMRGPSFEASLHFAGRFRCNRCGESFGMATSKLSAPAVMTFREVIRAEESRQVRVCSHAEADAVLGPCVIDYEATRSAMKARFLVVVRPETSS